MKLPNGEFAINNLAAINHLHLLHLLHQLYGTVFIPDAVYRELTDPNFLVSGATEVQTFDWATTARRDKKELSSFCIL